MTQHLSIRIPWKDNGYEGFICNKPCHNNSCLRLKNIAENKNDSFEEELAGCRIKGHEKDIPCLSEGGTFMSSGSHSKMTVHPYKVSNPKTHGHFQDTELIYPPFSLPARPFAWTMLRRNHDNDNIGTLAERYNINFHAEQEPVLSFDTNWVQEAKNQRAIFDCFYRNVIPRRSLVIPYAKQVPFIEDSKRVIMGIGFVDRVIPPVEHKTDGTGKLRSITWETMIGHTIRNDRKNGFLFPYQDMMVYAEGHPEFDISSITVFAEEDYFEEFSYATEHLSYDAVISVLLQSLKALTIIKQCIDGNWDDCISWVNERLTEVWKDRGAFPGAGMMLCAMGFHFGILIAEEVKASLTNNQNFVDYLERAISKPAQYFSDEVAKTIINTPERKAFNALNSERKALFWLLSRFTLSVDQARTLFNHGYYYKNNKGEKCFKDVDIACSDAEIILNPYIIFEQTRILEQDIRVAVGKVDMALLPPSTIRKQYPIPDPSNLVSDNDERRLRAISIDLLEKQAEKGHTVYPQSNLITDINNLPIEPTCTVTRDILDSVKEFFSQEIVVVAMKNGNSAYQLIRLQEIDNVIRKVVKKRVGTQKRHVVAENWRKIVNNAFQSSKLNYGDEKACQEKTAILKELAEARLSVLVGGAGTGKTTLLSLLCSSEKIKNGGILLLAPTGKARVRMRQAMQKQGLDISAKTVAQFLIQNDRFDYDTMRYHLSDISAKDVPQTIIIDECSMLTEEMFGALIQALKAAQRIIFVGDPNQLPPIGAGRPFVDLTNYLKKNIPNFPRVGKSYGELTVTCRQQREDGSERMDMILAEWYTDTAAELDDNIFVELQENKCAPDISFKTWKTPEELEQLILETVAEETGMSDINDIDGFDFSLGGVLNGDWMNFGSKPLMIDDWQILSAYRNDHIIGTATINRCIHQQYRKNVNLPHGHKKRLTKNMLGTDGIIFGEKVINVHNHKFDGYPKEGCLNFVANGEVGIVERIWQKPKDKINKHQIKFSSQPTYNYGWNSKVSDEGTSDLELAYALTVHKAQGSEFGKVILVIGEPSGLLSKELLYTAITRQTQKLVILYNDEAYHLRNYASKAYSDIAKRFTCLFDSPDIVEYNKKFYEAGLIHKTARGELVRSKSEVIIADALFDSGLPYEYEKALLLGNDGYKSPDFTIDDAESGSVYYWEHCGMMNDNSYCKRWERKRAVYKKNGIIEGKNLIVSYDDKNGSIDSMAIRDLIKKYLQ